jgi:parallel beta-helix repeat protein
MQRILTRTSDRSNLPARREGAFLPRFRQRYEEPKALPRKIEQALKKNSKRLLTGLALLLLLGQTPVFAATIVVGGPCTLTRAIVAANTDTRAGGFCRPGLGPDTIVLPLNRPQVLTDVNNRVYGPTGLPVIRARISIIGNGNTISRHPRAASFRIFAVAPTGSLRLSRLTLKGGLAPQLGGGGIRSLGRLVMADVVLNGNRAYGTGGGFWAQNTVISIRSQFVRNQSFCFPSFSPMVCNGGGGFYASGFAVPGATNVPHLTVDNSKFTGNAAGEDGGGLQIKGEATVSNSTFADNAAQQGGAMAIGTQLANIIKERLRAANTVQRSSAAAIGAQTSSVVMTNTTLTDNVARQSGGGIAIGDGSDITLNNTVVSGNRAPQAPEALAEPDSFVDTDAFNTFGQGGNAGVVGFAPGPTDTVAAQPPPDPTPGVPPTPPTAGLTPPPPLDQPPPPPLDQPPPPPLDQPLPPPVDQPPPTLEQPQPLPEDNSGPGDNSGPEDNGQPDDNGAPDDNGQPEDNSGPEDNGQPDDNSGPDDRSEQ